MASLEPQGQPEPRKRRNRKPRDASTNTNSLPPNEPNTVQEVQTVAQKLEFSMILEQRQPQMQPWPQILPQQGQPWILTTAPREFIPNSTLSADRPIQSISQWVAINQQPPRPEVQPAPVPNITRQVSFQPSKPRPAPAKKASPKQRGSKDEKLYPSPGSGGIPMVSDDYLKASVTSASHTPLPQHLLVVIDLNGTLLYRPNHKSPTKFHMRPHAQDFLKYCVSTFKVIIWSSAKPGNVAAMCNTILTPEIRDRVVAIWGRDKFGLTMADFNMRVQCYKRLSKIWQDPRIATSHPFYTDGYRWDQTNTVLIDDSREKARSEPYNLIEVPEWFGDMKERDEILPQVHDMLNTLSMHSNVSAWMRSQPWKPTVF